MAALISKTVYSLYYPETRALVDQLWQERPHALYEKNYEKHQDALHGPFLESWRGWIERAGVTLGAGFVHAYPTAGASEGIFALLARYAARAPRSRVHIFNGEYEGYHHQAAALATDCVRHERNSDSYRESLARELHPGDVFMISEPSAIDGHSWPGLADFVAFMAAGHPDVPLVVDLTYVGAVARPLEVDLSSPNVVAALASLSKPFGVYYHRIGALWSREPIDSLYGNLWFKNLFSIVLGERLIKSFGPMDLPRRYAPLQQRALEMALAQGVAAEGTAPADVVLLGTRRLHANAPLPAGCHDYLRAADGSGQVVRYCLSPGMDALLAEKR